MIVQGALKLMETEVTVRARQNDVALVKSVLDAAASKYQQTIRAATGATCTVRFSMDSQTLPTTSLGGVVLTCQNGI